MLEGKVERIYCATKSQVQPCRMFSEVWAQLVD